MSSDNLPLSGRVWRIDAGYWNRHPSADGVTSDLMTSAMGRFHDRARRAVKNINKEGVSSLIEWQKTVFSNIVIDSEDKVAVPDGGFEDRAVSAAAAELPSERDRYPNVHPELKSQSW